MKSRILAFHKTDHFLFRQWDRKIDDNILLKSLNSLDNQPSGRNLLIVSTDLIKRWAKKQEIDIRYSKCKDNLFIVLDNHSLITCFFANFSHYQGRRDNTNYLLIQKN